MGLNQATVSVIIPTYDASATLERALQSVLNQTLPPLEIIIVDDASTDDTVEICRRFPVCILTTSVNAGPAAARNRGLAAAKGEFIAILDADDAWRADRLQKLVDLAGQTQTDFIADNLIFFDAVADREGRLGYSAPWKTKFIAVADLMINDSGRTRFDYGLLKPVLRRSFLEANNLKYDESLRVGEDFKFYAEILFHGAKAVLTSEAGYIYTTRLGEISGQWSPFSKSSPDHYDHMLRASDDLMIKYKPVGELKKVMVKRKKYLDSIRLKHAAKKLRATGDIPHFLQLLLLNPVVAGSMLQGLIRRIRLQGLIRRIRDASVARAAR